MLFFRLPGQRGQAFTERLYWKISPLLDALNAQGIEATALGYDEGDLSSDADVSIWVANELVLEPTGEGKHVLWYLHQMHITVYSMALSFDAIFTTSKPHHEFLTAVYPDDMFVGYLPWPIDMNRGFEPAPLPQNHAAWSTIWNPIKADRLEKAADWLLHQRHDVAIYGGGWSKWMAAGADPKRVRGKAPVGADCQDVFGQATAYWAVETLRNRMSGFLDAFAYYALLAGKPVYTDSTYAIAEEIEHCFQICPTGAAGHGGALPTPLTKDQVDSAKDYLTRHHDPKALVVTVLNMLNAPTPERVPPRADRAIDTTKKPVDLAICEDPTLKISKLKLRSSPVSLVQLEYLLSIGTPVNLEYITVAPEVNVSKVDPQTPADLLQILGRRLGVALCVLQNFDVFNRVQCRQLMDVLDLQRYWALNSLPLHDLTLLLSNIAQEIAVGRVTEDTVKQAQRAYSYVKRFLDTPRHKIELPHPWPNVVSQVVSEARSEKFISGCLNHYQPLALANVRVDFPQLDLTAHDEDQPKLKRAVGVFLHVFYSDMAETLLTNAQALSVDAKYYVSTDTPNKAKLVAKIADQIGLQNVEVRVFKNRGRDIFPKIFGFADKYASHDIVLHLHSKRSPHTSGLNQWARQSMNALVGSTPQVNRILNAFEADDALDIVFAKPPQLLHASMSWTKNLRIAEHLTQDMGLQLSEPNSIFQFPAGSMFWARSKLIKQVVDLNLTQDQFPPEAGQEDGTTAHAIERLLGVFARGIKTI